MPRRTASQDTLRAVGQRLMWLREAFGHTQVEWADSLGVTNQVINRWEAGQRLPHLDIVATIIRETRASADYVFLGLLTVEMDPELRQYLLRHHRADLKVARTLAEHGRETSESRPAHARRTKQIPRAAVSL
jgi:DNA-binding XRE family transcriptional regulator